MIDKNEIDTCYRVMSIILPILSSQNVKIEYQLSLGGCTLFMDYLIHVQSAVKPPLLIYRIIIKTFKKMKEYVGIYIKTEKGTGTRWLWQQNEIPLPHNNCT